MMRPRPVADTSWGSAEARQGRGDSEFIHRLSEESYGWVQEAVAHVHGAQDHPIVQVAEFGPFPNFMEDPFIPLAPNDVHCLRVGDTVHQVDF